jgi:predicted nucleotidyltransferase
MVRTGQSESTRGSIDKGISANAEAAHFVKVLRAHMGTLAAEYGVRTLALFGSYVRGQQSQGSDLDLLVEFIELPSLFQFLRLEHHLSDLLGVNVDLVMKEALKPAIGRWILEEVVPV